MPELTRERNFWEIFERFSAIWSWRSQLQTTFTFERGRYSPAPAARVSTFFAYRRDGSVAQSLLGSLPLYFANAVIREKKLYKKNTKFCLIFFERYGIMGIRASHDRLRAENYTTGRTFCQVFFQKNKRAP